jgi:radical SAM superfamily enzyme YgiQ (UPF0313 family)
MSSTLLIHPNLYHTKLGTISPWDLPSLSLAYLAAVLEKNNLKVQILDAHILNLSLNKIGDYIRQNSPLLIGITSNIYTAKYSILTAKYIKKNFPDVVLVMGGPYPTIAFEKLLMNRVCDIVVIGEGEYTFLELVQKSTKNEMWKNIAGIAYLQNNQVVQTPTRLADINLDSIPFPAWHLFPSLKKYINLRGVTHRPYIPIITSRGCPYNCNWCTKYVHGYAFRPRSAENVVQEMILDVQKYHVREFAIVDDAFMMDISRVKKIFILMRKAKLDVSVNFYSGIRADSVDETLISLFRQCGVNRITFGVESGNQNVVKKIGKALNLQKVRESVQIAQKYGLITDGFFILGHPYDTTKTMDETIQFAIDCGFDHAYFFVAIPFPGTELYQIIESQGKFLTDYKYGIPSHIVEGQPIFELPNLPAEIVQKKFKEAYIRFYLRPQKILRLSLQYIKWIIQYRSLEILRWLISQVFFLFQRSDKKKL